MNDEGLADAGAADPFRLPRLHPGIGSAVRLGAVAGTEAKLGARSDSVSPTYSEVLSSRSLGPELTFLRSTASRYRA